MQPKLTSFTVSDLLSSICDILVSYKAHSGKLYSVKITLELPEDSFTRAVSELKDKSVNVDETDVFYGGFKFCIKKND